MSKKTVITYYTLLFQLLLAGVFIATVTDLEIAPIVYNTNSAWSIFVERWGKAPAFFILAYSLMIVGFGSSFEKRSTETVLTAFCLCGAFFSLVVFFKDAFSSYTSKGATLALLLALLCFGVMTTLVAVKNRTELRAMFAPALVAVAYIITVLLVVYVLKHVFTRVRYSDMLALKDFTLYTTWYDSRDGTGDSFPSGHVACFNCLLALAFFTHAYPKTAKLRIIFVPVVFILTALVAYARMQAGAHFMSDTVFSMLICNLAFLLYDLLAFKNKNGLCKN